MTSASDITVVTGRRTCRTCNYVNEAGNEFCVHCGAPMGNVPELLGDPGLAAQNRVSWQVYGVDTQMTGRDRELRHLTRSFEHVLKTGRLHATLLHGPIGLGKSRLIDEFSRVINTKFGNALLFSASWRDDSEPPYAIVDRVLRNRFYIPERLPEDEARERLLEGIKGIVKTPAAVEIAHRIGHLIDVRFPDSPFEMTAAGEARQASWHALTRLLKTDAGNNPLVVVLEDMHLASAESLELVPYLAEELLDAPILAVFSADPEVFERHEDLFERVADLERVELRPLSDEDIRSIVDQVLTRASDIPELLYRRVCDNSMGNPWIAEEILRLLMSQGAIDTLDAEWQIDAAQVARVRLPRGVDDVVESGISRLAPEEVSLLEEAAVVGERFWLGALTLLQHYLGDVPDSDFPWQGAPESDDALLAALQRLSDKDIIRRSAESRYPDEVEYTFKHAAARQHLLEGIEPERAANLHGLVAQWHELNRDRGIRELHAVIAEHHEAAGNRTRAAIAYMKAASRAQERHANRRARLFYEHVVELLDDTHLPLKIEALHEIGSICDLMGDYEAALPALERMLFYAYRLAGVGKSGAAHNKLGRVLRSLGRYNETLEHFEQAMHLFKRANDLIGVASTHDDIGKVHWIRADYPAALDHYKRALALRRDLGDKRSLALSLNHLGTLMVFQGDFREALVHLREALGLRKEIGDQRGVTDSLNNLGVILAERGDLEAALRLWSEAVEVAREIGDRMLEGMLRNNMGEVASNLGRVDEADEHLRAAEAICEECAEQRLLFDVMRNRGLLELRRDDAEQALELIERSLALAKRLKTRALEGIALRSKAEVHAHHLIGSTDAEHHAEAAEAAFRTAIEVLEEVGQEAELGRAYLSFGRFLVEQDQVESARKALGSAADAFERIGMRVPLAQTRELLESL